MRLISCAIGGEYEKSPEKELQLKKVQLTLPGQSCHHSTKKNTQIHHTFHSAKNQPQK